MAHIHKHTFSLNTPSPPPVGGSRLHCWFLLSTLHNYYNNVYTIIPSNGGVPVWALDIYYLNDKHISCNMENVACPLFALLACTRNLKLQYNPSVELAACSYLYCNIDLTKQAVVYRTTITAKRCTNYTEYHIQRKLRVLGYYFVASL